MFTQSINQSILFFNVALATNSYTSRITEGRNNLKVKPRQERRIKCILRRCLKMWAKTVRRQCQKVIIVP